MNSYQMAYNAYLAENYSSFNEALFPNNKFNQEELFLKKESFSRLSSYARETVEIICNFTFNKKPQKGGWEYSWRQISQHLRKDKGWSMRKTDKIRKEIKLFLQEN